MAFALKLQYMKLMKITISIDTPNPHEPIYSTLFFNHPGSFVGRASHLQAGVTGSSPAMHIFLEP